MEPQKVVNMVEGSREFQRLLRHGFLANMGYNAELDETGEETYGLNEWLHDHNGSPGSRRFLDWRYYTGLTGNYKRSSGASCQYPLHHYRPADPETETERRSRLLEEAKKREEKAEKKRLKKQKQKQRKRGENETQNPVKSEEQGSVDAQQPKTEKSSPDSEESKSSVKQLNPKKDTNSRNNSEDESSDEDCSNSYDTEDTEELDMTSTFVTKAALIAKRKFERKPRPERREKKVIPVREETKAVAEKKDGAASDSPSLENNIKISTDLANAGNKFASSGDYAMAVKFFTDAIKCNPTEYKFFGNRSFCFEKMQEYGKALADAELSLSMCPGWVKGLFRKGRALAGLKRYEEAAEAFREVLKLDNSCAEAAQELMRMQITQLMDFGFTREQSSNALIIHGTVKRAFEVLSRLKPQPANTNETQPGADPSAKTANENKRPPKELFPVWVGNLAYPITETTIMSLFNKVGVVFSVKLLTHKRCAFVNFTKHEDCEEAIRRFHGLELNSTRLAVRYPDRIPPGMGMSKSALKADDLQDDNLGSHAGNWRDVRPHRRHNEQHGTKT